MNTPEEQIKAAVASARRRNPTISESFATKAIVQGKSVATVKAELFDRLTSDPRAISRASMVTEIGKAGLDSGGNAGTANMRKLVTDMGMTPKDAA